MSPSTRIPATDRTALIRDGYVVNDKPSTSSAQASGSSRGGLRRYRPFRHDGRPHRWRSPSTRRSGFEADLHPAYAAKYGFRVLRPFAMAVGSDEPGRPATNARIDGLPAIWIGRIAKFALEYCRRRRHGNGSNRACRSHVVRRVKESCGVPDVRLPGQRRVRDAFAQPPKRLA